MVQLFALVRSVLAGCFHFQTKIDVAAQLLAEALTIVVFPSLSNVYIILIGANPFDFNSFLLMVIVCTPPSFVCLRVSKHRPLFLSKI